MITIIVKIGKKKIVIIVGNSNLKTYTIPWLFLNLILYIIIVIAYSVVCVLEGFAWL